VVVLLESAGPDVDAVAFEAAVSMAGSVALALLKKGLHVGLATADSWLPPAAGPAQTAQILKCLALVEARPREASARPATDATVVRVRPGVAVPSVEPARARSRRSA
jgi:uncharacterized protein (DUF58 family)